uniref:GrBNV_gp81-like protein n=1 Tax=Nilaparvata lugens endogenous nudivirus TaxID=1487700 RepID=X5G6P7_9VIRU|nr:GrBNV_gp81-like protein [Nilaparvata lugens endogenous nudivirus]
MIITFDSNVSTIPERVAKLLYPNQTRQWCTEQCSCINISKNSQLVVYYDTPIAMCDSLAKVPVENKEMFNIVYLDNRRDNDSRQRILAHLPHLKRAIVINSNDLEDKATTTTTTTDLCTSLYTYELTNVCTIADTIIIRFLALFINTFVKYRRFLHPSDIVLDIRGEPIKNTPVSKINKCSIYQFSRENLRPKQNHETDSVYY